MYVNEMSTYGVSGPIYNVKVDILKSPIILKEMNFWPMIFIEKYKGPCPIYLKIPLIIPTKFPTFY